MMIFTRYQYRVKRLGQQRDGIYHVGSFNKEHFAGETEFSNRLPRTEHLGGQTFAHDVALFDDEHAFGQSKTSSPYTETIAAQ